MNNGPHSWRCWGLNEARAGAVWAVVGGAAGGVGLEVMRVTVNTAVQKRMGVVGVGVGVGVEVVLVVAVGAAAVPVSGR